MLIRLQAARAASLNALPGLKRCPKLNSELSFTALVRPAAFGGGSLPCAEAFKEDLKLLVVMPPGDHSLSIRIHAS